MDGVNLGDSAGDLIALVGNWPSLIMMGVGGLLIYLAIAKEYEPVLLLPIGLGFPLSEAAGIGITSANYGLVSILVANEPALLGSVVTGGVLLMLVLPMVGL